MNTMGMSRLKIVCIFFVCPLGVSGYVIRDSCEVGVTVHRSSRVYIESLVSCFYCNTTDNRSYSRWNDYSGHSHFYNHR